MGDMQNNSRLPKKGILRRKKFFVAAFVLFSAVAYLIYANLGGLPYYVKPGELKAMGSEAFARTVRVEGTVAPENIEWSGKTLVLKFTITDEEASLPVTYKGVVPDTFKPGAKVIVEGTYNSDGNFQATRLLVGCPSKYERKELESRKD